MIFRIVGLLGIIFLLGCQTSHKLASTAAFSNSNEFKETIALLGTNDLHGALAPQKRLTREKKHTPPIPYTAGGVAILTSYIQILQSEFGNHFLWLDAGDAFQGSLESHLTQGSQMVEWFNANHLQGAAIGNHDFDFGIRSLEQRMTTAQYPYLATNILDRQTQELAHFPNTFPHKIIQRGNLKIGIIGLSTLLTPKTTSEQNVSHLIFQDLKEATLRESEQLRLLGAHIIVVTAHAGLECSSNFLPFKKGKEYFKRFHTSTEPQGLCGDHDEIVKLLQSLPAGTVDAVVAGHTHQVVHHWVAGVPVIQSGAFGQYLNVIYLTYDWSQKKLLEDETRIEGPIPVCEKIFKNQNDCNGDRPAPKSGRGPLVPWHFHGKLIEPHEKTQKWVNSIVEKSQEMSTKVIGEASQPIQHSYYQESELGNLAADAIRFAAKTDFSIINSGSLRESISSGPILFGSIFKIFPFENYIRILQVTTQELRTIIQVAEQGANGFSSVSGLRLHIIDPSYDAPLNDLNGDGREEAWKINRLIDLTLENGQPLDPKRLYTLSTSNFLASGGDGFDWPMSQIPLERTENKTHLGIRDAIVNYISTHSPINTVMNPLVNLEHPRLSFEKPVQLHHLKHKHSRRHKKKHPNPFTEGAAP